jgi:hypothetical protein
MRPMASQPGERMQDNGHFEPRRGDIGHHFGQMSPLRGWRNIWGGRVYPRLARHGPHDATRFAGFHRSRILRGVVTKSCAHPAAPGLARGARRLLLTAFCLLS